MTQEYKNPYELLRELEAYFSFRTDNVPSGEISDIKQSIRYTLKYEPKYYELHETV